MDGVAKLNGAIGSDCQVQHTANTSWVKHTITFKTKANFADNENLLFRLSPIVMSGNGYYVYICMPKLEVGKIATAYDANSDDMRPDYQEYRFAKNGSRNSAPALVKTDAEPSGWTTTQPTVGTLEYLWMIVAKKSATGVLLTNWSEPVRITPYDGKDGENGKSPAMVYRGVYDSTAISIVLMQSSTMAHTTLLVLMRVSSTMLLQRTHQSGIILVRSLKA